MQMARAAMKAMREPMDDMLAAAMGHIVGDANQHVQNLEDKTTWQTMIDTALGETG